MDFTVRFHLYVVGDNPRSTRAIENLRRLVDERLAGPCEVEVIDVLQFPDRAEDERILATPTLIKHFPLPRRRVTGDLSDAVRLLEAIGVAGQVDRPNNG